MSNQQVVGFLVITVGKNSKDAKGHATLRPWYLQIEKINVKRIRTNII